MVFLTSAQIVEFEYIRKVFILSDLSVQQFQAFSLPDQIEIFAISERAIVDFGLGLLSQITASNQTKLYIKNADLV